MVRNTNKPLPTRAMAKHKIFIGADGNVKGLCNNTLEYIPDLGAKTINRAADVEFNNTSGVWEIITPDGEVIGSHARRPEAIKLEIQLMENRMRQQLQSV